MFSRIEKLIYKKELTQNKLLVGEINAEKKSSRFLLCLYKGILIFLATYCSICGLLDAFNIPYSRPVLIFAFAFISLYVSMLYMNKVVFYVFYIVLFLFFTIELARYYIPANSGFQAAINMIFEEYSDYFALASIREGQELVANRVFSVTCAGIFLGTFTAILLNVTISGYMNAFETALVTFPYIEIALFIHKVPNPLYIFGLMFVYCCVLFLQLSKHSRMQVKGKRTHEFLRIKSKKQNTYAYLADYPVMNSAAFISVVIAGILVVILSGPLNLPISKVPKNAIHKQTQEMVKIYLQTGYTGFFNGYDATGGLSSGRLGGVSSIRPDFETDLNVTYAPANYDTVYLKGFTGTNYLQSGWYADSTYVTDLEKTREYPFGNQGKMNVENIDADARYDYLPYFSYSDDVTYSAQTKNNYDVIYVPNVTVNDYKPVIEDKLLEDEEYYKYVYESCLQVPDDLKETLDNTLAEIPDVENVDDINTYRLKSARQIYAYFENNFYYTMSPGSTPNRRDYVEYFLNTQKRGFCAHFATATVMLLREEGIPARYCEGYCIPLSLVYESGVLTENDYDEWYQGENITDLNSVIMVPVNDSYAHAWIEIYMEGYGFVPFEATIPSFEEEETGFNFFNFGSLFSNLTSNTLDFENLGNNTDTDGGTNLNATQFLELFNFNTESVTAVMVRIISVILLITALFFIVRFVTIRIRLAIYKKNNDEYHLVMYEYNKLVAKLKRKKFLTKKNPLPIDVKKAYDLYIAYYNNTHKKQKDIDTDKLFEYYERIMYS